MGFEIIKRVVQIDLPPDADLATLCRTWRRMRAAGIEHERLADFYRRYRDGLRMGVAHGLLSGSELQYGGGSGYRM
jgi:hypothetical protein